MTILSTHPWDIETDRRNGERATRDLVGEPAHLIAAIFAMVMETLGTGPASVGFITLCVAGGLRAHVLWPIWRRMFGHTWIKLLLAWMLWTVISVAWSPDFGEGLGRIGVLKFFAWLPLLWPLQRYWKLLVGGFLFATLVMQGIQASGVIFGATNGGGSLVRGLRHPTMTGVWSAIALSCWLFIPVIVGWRGIFLAVPFGTLSALGILWSGQRAAVIGEVIGAIIPGLVLWFGSSRLRPRIVATWLVGIVLLGTLYTIAGSPLTASFMRFSNEVAQSLRTDSMTLVEPRIAMWQLSMTAWKEHPVIGVGLGGYESTTENTMIDFQRGNMDIHAFKTSHNTYLMILTESGAIGLMIFVAWMVAFLMRGVQLLRDDPLRVGVFGGAIIWFSTAAFDSFHTRGVFLTVGVIMIALAVMPRTRPQRATRR